MLWFVAGSFWTLPRNRMRNIFSARLLQPGAGQLISNAQKQKNPMKNLHTLAILALAGSGFLLSSCGSEKLAVRKAALSTAQVTPKSTDPLLVTPQEPVATATVENHSTAEYARPQGKIATKNKVPPANRTRTSRSSHTLASVSSSPTLSYQKTPFKKPFKHLKLSEEAPTTNAFAIAGFVVSLVGLFIFGIVMGILAVVFSAIALAQIGSNKGKYKGKGFAIAGLVIGIVDIVVLLLVVSMA
jgi:hypothetical protein